MKEFKSFLSTDDKTNINYIIWKCEKPKAILQIVHGMAEYIDRYDDFASFMNENNILVVGHDHLGHGNSVNKNKDYGYFSEGDSFTHLIEDVYKVNSIIRTNYSNIPYFILGHSMGSFITRNYLKKYSYNVDGAIIMGTGGINYPSQIIRPITYALNKIIPTNKNRLIDKLAFGPFGNKFPEDDIMCWLSKNQENVNNYKEDNLLGFIFTNNGYHNLFKLSGKANKKKWFKEIRRDLPILITSGKEDPVGEFGKGPKKIYKDLVESKFNDIDIKIYEYLRHEILNESEKDVVYNDILTWISRK